MTIATLPDAEVLLSAFLRDSERVLTSPLSDNTYTDLPTRYSGPWPALRVLRVGGEPDPDLAFDSPILQVDVWGGPKVIAHDVAQIVRAALADELPFRNDEGCLMTVVRFGGLRYLPDPTFDPAKPRYNFDLTVRTRP